jgi:hypothetical protein
MKPRLKDPSFSPFWPLLVYSLLPGVAKIFDNRLAFLLNIPVICWILLRSRPELNRLGGLALAYSAIISAHTGLLILMGEASAVAAATAAYIYLFALAGLFVGRSLDALAMVRATFHIALIHGLIGLVLFDGIPLPGPAAELAMILKEGVFIFRMSSVAGSLVFGVLMVMGLACAGFLHLSTGRSRYIAAMGFLFACVILSQQRSAWLAGTLFILWHIFKVRGSAFKLLTIILAICGTAAYSVYLYAPEVSEFILERALGSFGSSGGAEVGIIDERSHMWVRAFDLFLQNPFGIGLGQGGYTAYMQDVNVDLVVTDGDYFHLLLENGIVAVAFYTFVFFNPIRLIILGRDLQAKYLCWVPLCAAVQMIGSNVTEFYFTNFLLWIFVAMAYAHRASVGGARRLPTSSRSPDPRLATSLP